MSSGRFVTRCLLQTGQRAYLRNQMAKEMTKRCLSTTTTTSSRGEDRMLALMASSLAIVSAMTVTMTEHSSDAAYTKKIRNSKKVPRKNQLVSLDHKYHVDWNACLGKGSFATVFPASVPGTGEKVALKKISKRFTSSKLFQRETRALLRVHESGGHPNIVSLRDMHEDDHHFYLVVEYVKGGELFDHLVHSGTYKERDAARLMSQLASALSFLHDNSIVHADLKPENLLLCCEDRQESSIKMIDFGSAVVEEQDKRKAANPPSSGTVAYWPPERFQNAHGGVNAAMDMWSVGVILYIMLFGSHPYDHEGNSSDHVVGARIKNNERPSLDHYVEKGLLSEDAADLMYKLLEKDPQKRMTAKQMLDHTWVKNNSSPKMIKVPQQQQQPRGLLSMVLETTSEKQMY